MRQTQRERERERETGVKESLWSLFSLLLTVTYTGSVRAAGDGPSANIYHVCFLFEVRLLDS